MTMRLNPRWLLISALLFSLQFCRAQTQVPPTISFNLGTTNSPESALWDISGAYSLDFVVNQHNGTQVPIQLSFQLLQNGSGQLSGPTNDFGEGLVVNNDNNSVFAVQPIISGKVTSASPGIARVHLNVSFSGSGSLGGQGPLTVRGNMVIDAETDPSTNGLVGTKFSTFNATFSNGASIHGKVDFSNPLPSGVDGTWNLTLNIVPTRTLSGTGTITTASKTIGLDLGGTVKGPVLKVKAVGANNVPNAQNGTGSSAKILLESPYDSIQLNGKIMGQKFNFFFTQPTS